jgi:hypothetical protein
MDDSSNVQEAASGVIGGFWSSCYEVLGIYDNVQVRQTECRPHLAKWANLLNLHVKSTGEPSEA